MKKRLLLQLAIGSLLSTNILHGLEIFQGGKKMGFTVEHLVSATGAEPQTGDLINLQDYTFYYDGSEKIELAAGFEFGGDLVTYRILNKKEVPFAVVIDKEEGFGSDDGSVSNPLTGMSKNELKHVRSLQVAKWDSQLKNQFATMDFSKCMVQITENSSSIKNLPSINNSVKYLDYERGEKSIDRKLLQSIDQLKYLRCRSNGQAVRELIKRNKSSLVILKTDYLGNHTAPNIFPKLKTLTINYSDLANLNLLKTAPLLENFRISAPSVKKIPLIKFPTIKELNILNTLVPVKDIEQFARLNPHCDVIGGRQRMIDQMAKSIVKIEFDDEFGKKVPSITDATVIKEFLKSLQVVEPVNIEKLEYIDLCPCCNMVFKLVDKNGAMTYLTAGEDNIMISSKKFSLYGPLKPGFYSKIIKFYENYLLKYIKVKNKTGEKLSLRSEKLLGKTLTDQLLAAKGEKQAAKILLTKERLADKSIAIAVVELYLHLKEFGSDSDSLESAIIYYVRKLGFLTVYESIKINELTDDQTKIIARHFSDAQYEAIYELCTKNPEFIPLYALACYQENKFDSVKSISCDHNDYRGFAKAFLTNKEIIPLLDRINPREWQKNKHKLREEVVEFLIYNMKPEDTDLIKSQLPYFSKRTQDKLMRTLNREVMQKSFLNQYKEYTTSEIGDVVGNIESYYKNGLVGIRDLTGKTLVTCKYNEIHVASPEHFVGHRNGKWWLLDLKENVIGKAYDKVVHRGFNKTGILLQRGSEVSYVSRTGDVKILPTLENFVYDEAFTPTRFIVKSKNKKIYSYALVDDKGNWVIKPERQHFTCRGAELLVCSKNKKKDLYNSTGKFLYTSTMVLNIEPFNEQGWTQVDSKPVTLLHKSGKVKKLPQYKYVQLYDKFIKFYKFRRRGYLDYNFKEVIAPSSSYRKYLGEGLFEVTTDQSKKVPHPNGTENLAESMFDEIVRGYTTNKKIVTLDGKVAFDLPKDCSIGMFKYGIASIHSRENGLTGLINTKGEVITEPFLPISHHIFAPNRLWVRNGRDFIIFDFNGNVVK